LNKHTQTIYAAPKSAILAQYCQNQIKHNKSKRAFTRKICHNRKWTHKTKARFCRLLRPPDWKETNLFWKK